MKLSELKNGESGVIVKVRGRGAFRRRIIEMGFVKGKTIEVVRNAPLKDPIEYKILGYHVSLRRSEASLIEVVAADEKDPVIPEYKEFSLLPPRQDESGDRRRARRRRGEGLRPGRRKKSGGNSLKDMKEKTITVALVGNPNSGKTTLYNHISKSSERVGNYSGVTVAVKESVFYLDGYTFIIADLPGTYSLTAYTSEELFVRNYILEKSPDIVVNVLDSTNLERNLYLTTQLIDMDIKVVAALNMFDELEESGDSLEYENLAKMTGVPMVPTVASKGKGIEQLFKKAIELYEDSDEIYRHVHINYGHDIENAIRVVQDEIKSPDNNYLTDRVSTRFLAIKLLEKDKGIQDIILEYCGNSMDVLLAATEETRKLEEHLKEDSESLITDAKYGYVTGALRETSTYVEKPRKTISEKIDNIFTSPILGFPFFLFFMWMAFLITFSLGSYPKEWIESFMEHLGSFIDYTMAPGLLRDLIVDGAIAGAGEVLSFLPNILILFFMISLMEDTGYMARASFIMDRLMHRIGLHGKSFIPLMMGFGCNVPAIMATRTLESRNDRLLTMLIVPFMSCSARLPVYVLLVGVIFPQSPGTMLFLIYILGIVIAVLSALAMKRVFFKGSDIPFVMELPPYRIPGLKTTLVHMWEKGVEYLKKIAGIVLIASIIIWALSSFPEDIDYSVDYEQKMAVVEQTYSPVIATAPEAEAEKLEEQMMLEKQDLELARQREHIAGSYLGRMGTSLEPVLNPLGFDWKMGVSLLSGFAAKEIIVSTMGILYSGRITGEPDEESISAVIRGNGETPLFTPLVALAFMVFVLVYFPCLAAVITIKRESGSWKWALFAVVYTTLLAYILAFLIFQAGSLMGF